MHHGHADPSEPDLIDSPYHEGERAVQEESGTRELSERMGRRMIRASLPDQHRAFYAQLPFVLVGSLDGQARPWASMLTGPLASFPCRMHPACTSRPRRTRSNPLHEALQLGAALGD